ETSRVHHAARRRGGVAARGARAAKAADDRASRLASFGEGSSTRAEPNPSTGPRPCLFSAGFSAGLWRRRSTMAPLDSQPAATILQTESSRRSTTSDYDRLAKLAEEQLADQEKRATGD